MKKEKETEEKLVLFCVLCRTILDTYLPLRTMTEDKLGVKSSASSSLESLPAPQPTFTTSQGSDV